MEVRSETIKMYVTPEEKMLIERASELMEVSQSEFLRQELIQSAKNQIKYNEMAEKYNTIRNKYENLKAGMVMYLRFKVD